MTPLLLSKNRAVQLVPFNDQHLSSRYVSWLNDPVATRYSEQRHRKHDLESCRDFRRQIATSGHFWAVEILTPVGIDHVGNVTAYIDQPNRSADLTILLGEVAARGKGIGKVAWGLALDWLLSPAGGMRLVTAGTMAANESMLGTMRACGMRECGRIQGRFLLDGAPVDLVISAKTEEDSR